MELVVVVQGPEVTLKLSCFSCDFCKSQSYACQGDSGHEYYCHHPERLTVSGTPQHIGDSHTRTPAWCPLRHIAISKLIRELSR